MLRTAPERGSPSNTLPLSRWPRKSAVCCRGEEQSWARIRSRVRLLWKPWCVVFPWCTWQRKATQARTRGFILKGQDPAGWHHVPKPPGGPPVTYNIVFHLFSPWNASPDVGRSPEESPWFSLSNLHLAGASGSCSGPFRVTGVTSGRIHRGYGARWHGEKPGLLLGQIT